VGEHGCGPRRRLVQRTTRRAERLEQFVINDPSYDAQYSLALAAASSRWPVTICVAGDGQVSQDQDGFFKNITVAWAPLDLDD